VLSKSFANFFAAEAEEIGAILSRNKRVYADALANAKDAIQITKRMKLQRLELKVCITFYASLMLQL
jgi:hypothetical protein